MCERELETEQNCNILTPTLLAITAFLSRSPGLLNLIPASSLELTRSSCHQGYIIIWRPLFFLWASQFCTQFNPSTVKVISWYSSTGYTCYLHWCISYLDSLARSEVNIQLCGYGTAGLMTITSDKNGCLNKGLNLPRIPFSLSLSLTDNILLPPINIKLGVMKNFVKPMDMEG